MALETVRAWFDRVAANAAEETVVMKRARAKLLAARAKAKKTTTSVSSHDRKGSGVKSHSRKLNGKQQRGAIAQELLK